MSAVLEPEEDDDVPTLDEEFWAHAKQRARPERLSDNINIDHGNGYPRATYMDDGDNMLRITEGGQGRIYLAIENGTENLDVFITDKDAITLARFILELAGKF
jgi:hypothetical protein